MAARNPETFPEKLRALIRRAGLRATPSRVAVLELLHHALRPISHAETVGALTGQAWDRATIYRNLRDFVRVGLVRKTELGDRVWRFELAAAAHSSRDHPHFVCTECGQVLCLPDVEVSLPPQGGQPQALREHQYELQIRGYCDNCR